MSGTLGLSRMRLVLDPWIEARRALEGARQEHPGFADLRHLLGLLYLAQQEYGAAIQEFDAALGTNASFLRARFARLVACRLRDGVLDLADWNREIPAATLAEPERSLWTAWFLSQGGDRAGARAVLGHLANRTEFAAAAWYARSAYEQSWGVPEAAREALAAAALAHRLYRSILESRGLIGRDRPIRSLPPDFPFQLLGEPGAEVWHPVAADLCQYLGSLCARHGSVEEAHAFYDEAFLRQGLESAHQVRLSQLALARGNEEEAVRALCRAIEVDPTSVAARIALGFEYQSQGYQEEALVQFEVASRLRPGWPDVQYNLGLLYGAQGRREDAVRCLRKALEINPSYFQARMSLAQVLLQQEHHDEALKELERLTLHGVRSADLCVQKAEAYLALDRAQEAVRELEEAVQVNPGYARSYYTLGQAYRRLGLRRKARNAWQQYLDHSRNWRDLQPAVPGEEGGQ